MRLLSQGIWYGAVPWSSELGPHTTLEACRMFALHFYCVLSPVFRYWGSWKARDSKNYMCICTHWSHHQNTVSKPGQRFHVFTSVSSLSNRCLNCQPYNEKWQCGKCLDLAVHAGTWIWFSVFEATVLLVKFKLMYKHPWIVLNVAPIFWMSKVYVNSKHFPYHHTWTVPVTTKKSTTLKSVVVT